MLSERMFTWVAQGRGRDMGAAVQLEEPLIKSADLEGFITVMQCPNGTTIIDEKAKKR